MTRTSCYSFAPWAVSDTLAYGFAAFNASSCGQCYQLQFTGQSHNGNADPGSTSLCGKTMIVQVVNIGNITQGQFDLMIPGGGVGQNTGACPTQWGVPASMLGDVNGGLLLTCQQQNGSYQAQLSCTKNACASLFTSSNESSLLAGCNWIADWFGGASNPNVLYQPVACPSAITSVSGLQ